MTDPRLLLLALFVALSWFTESNGASRVALVIGNDEYPEDGNFVSLGNCINDASLIRNSLEEAGFQVIYRENVNRYEMEEALVEFEKTIEEGAAAVFYFAGHGIEDEGKNHLMASNARLQSRAMLGEESLNAETFVGAMVGAGAKSSIVFLDCCRETPNLAWQSRSVKKRGLADMKINFNNKDVLICYAATPGNVAFDGTDGNQKNSPYALSLSRRMLEGKHLRAMMQDVLEDVNKMTKGAQRPWENGSFLEPFYFVRVKYQEVDVPEKEFSSSVGIKMVGIPAGRFTMGSPSDEKGRDPDEGPIEVEIKEAFWIGKFEVTQEEWESVMKYNPSQFKGVMHPVEMISYKDAIKFCDRLTRMDRASEIISEMHEYRLPTEAEWEYAARAGSHAVFPWGDAAGGRHANFDGAYPYGKEKQTDPKDRTVSVGTYSPNDWGLHDMAGNVWEWCLDFYQAEMNRKTDSPISDIRCIRGGSWGTKGIDLRVANRQPLSPQFAYDDIGFRVVLVINPLRRTNAIIARPATPPSEPE